MCFSVCTCLWLGLGFDTLAHLHVCFEDKEYIHLCTVCHLKYYNNRGLFTQKINPCKYVLTLYKNTG